MASNGPFDPRLSGRPAGSVVPGIAASATFHAFVTPARFLVKFSWGVTLIATWRNLLGNSGADGWSFLV